MPLHPEGFACELFNEDVSAFECELCQCVVREPVEHSVCSQLYCTDCIKLALSKMRPPACPHCMTPASLADFRRINRLLRQMLDTKQMHCVHYPECSHVCTFGTLEKHLSECALQTVECRFGGCGALVLRRDLAEHEANCSRRTQRCEFCDDIVLASSMETHTQSSCRRAPVSCKFCEVCVPREDLSTHLAHDCEKQPVKCVIEGCTHTMPKHEVQAHLDANLSGHLAQVQQQMLVGGGVVVCCVCVFPNPSTSHNSRCVLLLMAGHEEDGCRAERPSRSFAAGACAEGRGDHGAAESASNGAELGRARAGASHGLRSGRCTGRVGLQGFRSA